MKCPRCGSDQTQLSWLREFNVVYWCSNCHTGFDVNRHRSNLQRPTSPSVTSDGAHPAAVASEKSA
jgi:hypothetical protein